jgi:hypothetical protein
VVQDSGTASTQSASTQSVEHAKALNAVMSMAEAMKMFCAQNKLDMPKELTQMVEEVVGERTSERPKEISVRSQTFRLTRLRNKKNKVAAEIAELQQAWEARRLEILQQYAEAEIQHNDLVATMVETLKKIKEDIKQVRAEFQATGTALLEDLQPSDNEEINNSLPPTQEYPVEVKEIDMKAALSQADADTVQKIKDALVKAKAHAPLVPPSKKTIQGVVGKKRNAKGTEVQDVESSDGEPELIADASPFQEAGASLTTSA